MTASPNKPNNTRVDSTRSQRKTKEHLEKPVRKRYVDGRFQMQLEEDGDDSTGESWMQKSGL